MLGANYSMPAYLPSPLPPVLKCALLRGGGGSNFQEHTQLCRIFQTMQLYNRSSLLGHLITRRYYWFPEQEFKQVRLMSSHVTLGSFQELSISPHGKQQPPYRVQMIESSTCCHSTLEGSCNGHQYERIQLYFSSHTLEHEPTFLPSVLALV